jgi:sigma-B regulation protein RsbU (phosphoserine phosphatase)
MSAVDPQITASELLRVFHDGEPIFFWSCLHDGCHCRSGIFFPATQADSLTIYFALFASLYGQRLWVQAGVLDVLVPPSQLFERVRSGIDFLVPIPALLFFEAARLLHRLGRLSVTSWESFSARYADPLSRSDLRLRITPSTTPCGTTWPEHSAISSRSKTFGFVALPAALGYVAARQTMERDQQLKAIQKELEVARHIQLSILPAEFPSSEAFRGEG